MAATLGVHVSTVSRILNGAPDAAKGAASAELCERVRQLARELNYRPNLQASSLRTQRSRDIGLLLPAIAEPMAAQWHEGLEGAARAAGYQLLACTTQGGTERVRKLLERPLAGVVVADTSPGCSELLAALNSQQVPYVLLGQVLPGQPGVACDNAAAGQEVAALFHARGRRAPALLASSLGAVPVAECVAGFKQAWAELAGAAATVLCAEGTNGQALAEPLLAQGVDALWALDDLLALQACAAVQASGQAVGKEVSVAGYHDQPWAACLPVPLASVRVPAERMGRLALQVLLRHIGGKGGNPLRLSAELVRRASA